MAKLGKRLRRLSDGYAFAGFRARATVRGVFGDPDVLIVRLEPRSKNDLRLLRAGSAGTIGGCGKFAICRAQDFGFLSN